MVATDVAARGLDIDNIDVIVQYSVRNVDAFVHRAGRTGRAGKDGLNIVFAERDELKFLKELEDNLNINLNLINNMANVKSNSTASSESNDEDNVEAKTSESSKALNKEVERLKITLQKSPSNLASGSHVASLCAYYSQLDAEKQQVFLANVFA